MAAMVKEELKTSAVEEASELPPGVEHSSEALEDTVALDIYTPTRLDWITGEDRPLHYNPDDFYGRYEISGQ